jgi:hypothetical protein
VFEPDAFDRYWRPVLDDLKWKLIVILPTLETTIARSRQRQKRVKEKHTQTQHDRCAQWDESIRIDTTDLDPDQSLALVFDRLAN